MLIDIAILLAVMIGTLLYGLVVPAVVRHIFINGVTVDSRELASTVGFRIAAFVGLVVSLIVANLIAEYTDISDVVESEATELIKVDVALGWINSEESELARAALRAYANSVVSQEWNSMGSGGFSVETGLKFQELQV